MSISGLGPSPDVDMEGVDYFMRVLATAKEYGLDVEFFANFTSGIRAGMQFVEAIQFAAAEWDL